MACGVPWTLVIPSGLPVRSFVAKLPSVADDLGSISSIWRKRWLSQAAISVGQRVAVARRPALQDVGDVDVLAGEPDPVEQLVEQLAGAADEREPRCPRGSPAPRRRTSGRRPAFPAPKTALVRVSYSGHSCSSRLLCRERPAARAAP